MGALRKEDVAGLITFLEQNKDRDGNVTLNDVIDLAEMMTGSMREFLGVLMCERLDFDGIAVRCVLGGAAGAASLAETAHAPWHFSMAVGSQSDGTGDRISALSDLGHPGCSMEQPGVTLGTGTVTGTGTGGRYSSGTGAGPGPGPGTGAGTLVPFATLPD